MRNKRSAKAGDKLSEGEQRRQSWQSQQRMTAGEDRRERRWVTGPALRRMLDISPPTLWRWRHAAGFPVAKLINGRLYFALDEVEAWMAAQPNAACDQPHERA
jgi:hypothetical protein